MSTLSTPRPPLRDWVDELRTRGATLQTDGGDLRVMPERPGDRDHIAIYRHALELAAAGTHPAWWAYVLGRTDQLDVDDMPTVPDPRDHHGGYGWPCATCGRPADVLDHTLLPWCEEHA